MKTQNITTNDANIVIRVVRAFNVPVREKVLENLHQNQRTLLPLTEHEERVEYEHKVVDYVSIHVARLYSARGMCTYEKC